MAGAVRLRDLLGKRVLVARETARQLLPTLEAEFEGTRRDTELDFEGIDIVSPSFFDELLGMTVRSRATSGAARWSLRITKCSTDLAPFSTIANTYGLRIDHRRGSWVVAPKSRKGATLPT